MYFAPIGSYVQFGITGPMAHLCQFGNLWLMGTYIRNRIIILIIETLSYFISLHAVYELSVYKIKQHGRHNHCILILHFDNFYESSF